MAKASAKILISGEHSVVYGAPAIGIPLMDYFTITEIKNNNKNEIKCYIDTVNIAQSININKLPSIRNSIDILYLKFLRNQIKIEQILKNKFSMIFYLISLFIYKNNILITQGFSLIIKSNIPIKSNMGSSAAVITSVLRSLEGYFQIKMAESLFFSIARTVENLQHGHSSGIDINIIMREKIVFFYKKNIYIKHKLPGNYLIVNTGTAESTTGQCVVHAEQFFKNSNLLQKFTNTTLKINRSIVENNFEQLQAGIHENQNLLFQIGVVPEKIQNLIYSIEISCINTICKISGSGAIKGNNAGCLLIAYKDPYTFSQIEQICKLHGYNHVKKLTII